MADITRTIVMPEETSVTMLTRDRFDIPSANGKRHNMFSPYHPRIIHDAEGVISEDNGALRIRPKSTPAWGTSSVIYGPFARANGLTFATVLLNGYIHSTNPQPATHSDNSNGTLSSKTFWQRLLGNDPQQGLSYTQANGGGDSAENLIAGWFDEAATKAGSNPLATSSTLVIRTDDKGNSTLAALSNNKFVTVIPQLLNLPLCLVTILRENGAAYYAASMDEYGDLPALPTLRPLAIDLSGNSKSIYAGVDQHHLGQNATATSTRVYDIRIAHVGAWQHWYGTAQVADSLKGKGVLQNNSAETEQAWRVRGYLLRTPDGLVGTQANTYAQIHAEQPNGLIHAQIDSNQANARIAFYWRVSPQGDGWRVILSPFGSVVQCSILGGWIKIGSTKKGLKIGRTQALQIRDDGEHVGIDLDGDLLFAFDDRYNRTETGLGVALDHGVILHHLEAHARQIELPDRFDIALPYAPQRPGVMAVWDDLTGQKQRPLQESKTAVGDREWLLGIGSADLQRTPRGTQVITSIPERTIYTFSWHDVAFASLAVDIVPPRLGNQPQYARGGIVFWQESDDYILISSELAHNEDRAAIIVSYQLKENKATV
ncbi:MAG TPA: hypothetical protein ENJ56_08075, partial [Anaerolineae bacterium]|nr:hypothetical protein [Anaerolineae bacterium]